MAMLHSMPGRNRAGSTAACQRHHDCAGIDWNGLRRSQDWRRLADQFLICAKAAKQVRFDRIPRYELPSRMSADHCKIDADNG
jgi:hypothetical protein